MEEAMWSFEGHVVLFICCVHGVLVGNACDKGMTRL